MKEKRLISIITVLIALFAVAGLLFSCENNKTVSSDLANLSKGEASPFLKGTFWTGMPEDGNDEERILFDQTFNTVTGSHAYKYALYKVTGMEVEFDLTEFANNRKNISIQEFKNLFIGGLESDILKLESILAGNPSNKDDLEKELAETKEELEVLKKMSLTEVEKKYAQLLSELRKSGEQLLPFAKFKGILNEAKTELKIEKYPVLHQNNLTAKKIVFKKQ